MQQQAADLQRLQSQLDQERAATEAVRVDLAKERLRAESQKELADSLKNERESLRQAIDQERGGSARGGEIPGDSERFRGAAPEATRSNDPMTSRLRGMSFKPRQAWGYALNETRTLPLQVDVVGRVLLPPTGDTNQHPGIASREQTHL